VVKQYVTFGQDHRHEIDGVILNADCVAVFEAPDADSGREKAFELFGRKFCFHYAGTPPNMQYFPRGEVNVE
jgi:hypothetical protein